MLINPTKKALSLFSALPQVSDSQASKAFSTANPFFSWHANYYNLHRKKVLVLVNDLTMMPIVIADVNAQSKKQLAQMIVEGIWSAFRWAGIASEQIQQYLDLAGKIEVSSGFNRQITSVTTMYIRMAEHVQKLDTNERIQKELMVWLAEGGVRSLPDYYPKAALVKAMAQNLQLHPVTEEHFVQTKKEQATLARPIEVTWQDFRQWQVYEAQEGWFEGYEEVAKEVRENNRLVLAAFKHFLKEQLGLSEKVIRGHLNNTSFYLDEYLLYYGIQTAISDFSAPVDFLSDFFTRKAMWATPAEVKRMGASLKKFYDFLAQAQVLTKVDLKAVKEEIAMGVLLGVDNLEIMDNRNFDSWW